METEANIQTFSYRNWSIKDLLYGKIALFSLGKQHIIPNGQDSVILPAWAANHGLI